MEIQSQADIVAAVTLHSREEIQSQADTVVEVRYTQEEVHNRDPDPGRH